MSFTSVLLKVISIVLVLEYVRAQEIYDDKYGKINFKVVNKLPRKFDIRAENAIADFKKYATDIQDLTAGRNLTIIYRVKVEVLDPTNKLTKKKTFLKKKKSKSYNIPLKKQSMKLSNFEVLMRKLAEENWQKPVNYDVLQLHIPTVQPDMILSTKQIQLKFKPIMSQLRKNFTKIIKPVKNKVITLSVD